MILGTTRYYSLTEFVSRLQAATRGLVHVSPGRGSCTGWVIAPGLVVIPGYALAGEGESQRITCRALDGSAHTEAEVVFRPSALSDTQPALLRLSGDLPVERLTLHLAATEPEQRLLILHYPGGIPQAQLSLGRVVAAQSLGVLAHDAPTEAGSGGAPVLDAATLGVLGTHVAGNPQYNYNQAVPIAAMLDTLHDSPYWSVIAAEHRIASLATASSGEPEAAGPALLPHALRWEFDPAACTEAEREALRPLVEDPDDKLWSMLPDERRILIKAADTLPPPRTGRPDDHPGQRAIDRILAGPPYDLAEVGDDELPYWLQATGWFANALPGLPTPAEVHRTLARRRVRGRLDALVGDRLWGRDAELDRLWDWHAAPDAGPMVVTGPGGVGKSALVAEFARLLPADRMLLWLDFDRADLAPDDADSVLAALTEQVTVQLDGPVPPPVGGEGWQAAADRLARLVRGRDPLLVLDGFEIAQHAPEHEEIWTVLNRLLGLGAAMHVLVSGRAPVPGLTLAGRSAEALTLTGLPDPAAEAWLRSMGVTRRDQLDIALRVADGVPLVLKLAARLIAAGGDLTDLPQQLVEAYLYRRILNRVVDAALQPLAHDALVLRRLTAPILIEVLGDRLPGDRDPATILVQIAQELSLVEGLDVTPPASGTVSLRLRPEVRTATLRLLERESGDLVSGIDRRAADWYRTLATPTVEETAELVYHLLRLGELSDARRAWVDGCASLLRGADEEIPERFPEARAWLRGRTSDATAGAEVWEPQMYAKVLQLIKRNNVRGAAKELASRAERSPNSLLLPYDAWVRWHLHGDAAGARAVLGKPRNRAEQVLAAWLAALNGQPRAADALLAPLDSPSVWDLPTSALAVRAARIMLTVDLSDEDRLAEAVRYDERLAEGLRRLLYPGDVVLPSLSGRLAGEVGHRLESLRSPVQVGSPADFVDSLEHERHYRTRTDHPRLRIGPDARPAWRAAELGLRLEDVVPLARDGTIESEVRLGLDLAVRAVWRWSLATRDSFIPEMFEAVLSSPVDRPTSLVVSAARSLSAFHGQDLLMPDGSLLTDVAGAALARSGEYRGLDAVEPVLDREQRRLQSHELLFDPKERVWSYIPWTASPFVNLMAYVIPPDPLLLLTRIELGIPETL